MGIACEVLGQGKNCWEDVNARSSIFEADVNDSQDIVCLLVDELIQLLLVVNVCDELAGLDSICGMVRVVQDAYSNDKTLNAWPCSLDLDA